MDCEKDFEDDFDPVLNDPLPLCPPTPATPATPQSPTCASPPDGSELQAKIDLLKKKMIEPELKSQRACRDATNAKKKLLRSQKNLVKKTAEVKNMKEQFKKKSASVQAVVEKFPPVPRALFEILLKNQKKINWYKEREAMELALSIFYRSPSAYKTLRQSGFLLPHSSTLRRRIGKVLAKPGLCPVVKDMMRIRALSLQTHEKLVTLSLDGMTITPGLQYKPHSDTLLGYVDYGYYGQEQKVADQGIVMMVRGLTLRWKQVIGYCLVAHNLPFDAPSAMIADAIQSLKESGFTVKAVIMDQEATQWKWVKSKA
jgi:hypothetical protein